MRRVVFLSYDNGACLRCMLQGNKRGNKTTDNPYCPITCGCCGETGDFDKFTSTPVGDDLPKGHFQSVLRDCLEDRRRGEAKMLPSGFVMPPKIKVVKSEGRL